MDLLIALTAVLIILIIVNVTLSITNNDVSDIVYEKNIKRRLNPRIITDEQIKSLNTITYNINKKKKESVDEIDNDAMKLIKEQFSIPMQDRSETNKEYDGIQGTNMAIFDKEFEGIYTPIYEKKRNHKIVRSYEKDGYH